MSKMMHRVTIKDGAITLPPELRVEFGIQDGTILLVEVRDGRIMPRRDVIETFDRVEPDTHRLETDASLLASTCRVF